MINAIDLPRHGFSVIPWLEYKNGNTPSWWTDYNHVKHNRDTFFHKANLINTIESIKVIPIVKTKIKYF